MSSFSMMDRFRYKLTQLTKFPKGNLTATFLNLRNRGFQPTHIVDIGANKAKWSRDAARVYPNCTYTLVEPQTELAPYIDRFCNQADNRKWIKAGAGAKPGLMTFTVCPDTVSSSFAVSSESAREQGFEQRELPIVTVDQLVKDVGIQPEIVKIDAEGLEPDVLAGAAKTLQETELVFLEAHLLGESNDPSGFVALVNLMVEYGFSPYDFTWFGKRRLDNAVTLTEIVFARDSGCLREKKGWHAA